jgi:hypothetical protein
MYFKKIYLKGDIIMNNNKLPYSLNNMAPSFRGLNPGSTCNEYETLPPIYLNVRREVLLNVGVGNPLDPLDFEPITTDIIVGANDVDPTFTRVISTTITEPVIVYPCENITEGVVAFASLTECRVIAAVVFSTVVYSPTSVQMFSLYQSHVGLDQIVDYFSPNSIITSDKDFSIDIKLKNSTYEDLNYTGYTNLQFILDNPDGDPNGPGTYIFTVVPEARIK